MSTDKLLFRTVTERDHDAIWNIIKEVIKTRDTYVFYPDSSRDKMLAYWLAPEKKVYVAELSGQVVGTFNLRDNHPDKGSHVANASYMVAPTHYGKGIGKAMGEYSLQEARRIGYQAMQFNIVIKSNERAVKLWKQIGFKIIGEIPNAIQHPSFGMINAYIMYREL